MAPGSTQFLHLDTISLWSGRAARVCAIALGFSIPISVALDNVLLVLVLAFWLAALDFRGKFAQISRNPAALAALAMFALFIAGLAYGVREPGDGLHYLGKYADLAFVPIFVTLFDTEIARRRACLAFAAAMLLTLALSYLIGAGLLPGDIFVSGQRDASVFKKSLTHNFLMAFTVFLFLQLGRSAALAPQRRIWLALAALAGVNVVLMNEGKTGQIVLFALMTYSAFATLSRKAAFFTVLGMTLLGFALMTSTSNRFSTAVTDGSTWQSDKPAMSSTAQRLEFYRNSLETAFARPLFGSGTGSFPKVYADHVQGSAIAPTDNPHNEYLNIAVQLGIVGVLMLLYLFYSEWRLAPGLTTEHERHLARGLVITFAIGCLFNSLLMDHVEGLFFAWASGLFFAGLRSPSPSAAGATRHCP